MSFYLKTQFSYPKITLESFLCVYPKAFFSHYYGRDKEKDKNNCSCEWHLPLYFKQHGEEEKSNTPFGGGYLLVR